MIRFLFIILSSNLLLCEDELLIHTSTPKTFEGLSQVVHFQDDIISGAKPEGIDGFKSLKNMNVRTIVCVDGVAPDVETARKYGLKTIHLPLKYDAPSSEQIFDLTTIVARSRVIGKVYIHCHQGKHRSATAAAIVSIALGDLTFEEATTRMHESETSSEYQGLWNAVKNTTVIHVNDLLCNQKVYPSRVEPKGMICQMIAVDESMDNLTRFQNANWNAPKEHPDLVGVAEAGIIVDTFRKIQCSNEVKNFPKDFERQLDYALQQAGGLEEALMQKLSKTELDVCMKRMEQSCINCHSMFRK